MVRHPQFPKLYQISTVCDCRLSESWSALHQSVLYWLEAIWQLVSNPRGSPRIHLSALPCALIKISSRKSFAFTICCLDPTWKSSPDGRSCNINATDTIVLIRSRDNARGALQMLNGKEMTNSQWIVLQLIALPMSTILFGNLPKLCINTCTNVQCTIQFSMLKSFTRLRLPYPRFLAKEVACEFTLDYNWRCINREHNSYASLVSNCYL